MPSTANKGYEVQVTGSNEDVWGTLLNTQMIEYVDQNLGGLVTKTLSNSPVVLSASESRDLTVRLIGTLTGNVLVTTACKGMTIVENRTSGPFTVTFGNGVGTPVEILQNAAAIVVTDATNGPRVAGDSLAGVPPGTKLLCTNAAAPAGWTKLTSNANRGIRVTSGSGGAVAGSAGFTDIFTTRGLTGTVNGTAITENQMPGHRHHEFVNTESATQLTPDNYPVVERAGAGDFNYTIRSSLAEPTLGKSGSTGGGQSHAHSMSIDNMNFNLAYLDVIEIQKN